MGSNGTAVAAVALGVGVTAISFAAIFFREAAPTHPLVMAGVRLAIAAALLSPLVVRGARAGRLPPEVLRGALLAGVLYGVHFGAWVSSLTMTSVAASVTLVTATPLLLALHALRTGLDRPDRRHAVALGLALLGLGLIGGADLLAGGEALYGDGLALLGCAAMAGYLLVVRRLGRDLDVWAFSGIACAVGAACLLGTAAASGVPIAFPTWEAFGYIALAALVPQLVGHGALTWSLRHLRPTVVGLATVGEPVGSTLLAWLWLGEALTVGVGIGCAITLCAVTVAIVPRSDPRGA